MSDLHTRAWYDEVGNGDISRQTIIIIVVVVVVVLILGLLTCLLCRRRRRNRLQRSRAQAVTLPMHDTRPPPPPPAYAHPVPTRTVPTYPLRQKDSIKTTSSVSSHSTPPSSSQHKVARKPTIQSSPPKPVVSQGSPSPRTAPALPARKSIFRRPVPPIHTVEDLAPAQPVDENDIIPQVTRYEYRRGENPFGERGLDGRHPGMAEIEAGDAGGERTDKPKQTEQREDEGTDIDAPPVYAELAGVKES